MKPNANDIKSLLEYIVFLEERISRARKQGIPTDDLKLNRTLALRQINPLQQATPATKKEFEAVRG